MPRNDLPGRQSPARRFPSRSLYPHLMPALALTLILAGCGDDESASGPVVPPPAEDWDQQNLYEGVVQGQGIGRFSAEDGQGDPGGGLWDLQSAQTVTAGRAGVLARIAVPVRNLGGATEPVHLTLRLLQENLRPEPDDNLSLGQVSLPASSFLDVDLLNPGTWPVFEVATLGMVVEPGRKFCFSVSTVDTTAYILNPEYGAGYPRGDAFRRNRADGPDWTSLPRSDFGFRTWVEAP